MQNPFENALNQIKRANDKEFPKELIDKLMHPDRQVRISIPVKMDDGSQKDFEGYAWSTTTKEVRTKEGIVFTKTQI
ncbi:MAG: hypothetical protein R3B65_02925 [Candidatus Paceibacterota bacterium]